MSVRRPFDEVLNDWLDDGPTSAPREDLAALLQAFPAVRQRRRFGRENLPMPSIARLAVAAAFVALVAGVAALQLPGTTGPAATPAPTPGWAERFETLTARSFKHPFSYAVDPSTGLVLKGSPDANIHQFGIPDPATGGYQALTIVVKIGTPLRRDICSQTGGELLRGYTPRQFADYLMALPGFRVTEGQATTVDGRDALVIDVDQLPRTARPCDEIWVWTDNEVSFTEAAGEGGWTRRFLAFQVEGETVLVIVVADDDDMERRLAMAMAFVDSIHFQAPDAGPSPSR